MSKTNEIRPDIGIIDETKLEAFWKALAKLSEKDQSKITDCVGMLKENVEREKEQTLRALAETKNFQRRASEETSRIMRYANEDVLSSLLPVIDNFERAIKLDDQDLTDELSKFLSGFKMIYSSLIKILNDYEVKEIIASGSEFDPNYHQAVITEKDETKPAGVVLEVLQKGYMYKDKVIRPAMVKVNE